MSRHVNAKCEVCGGELRVRVGHKSTARVVQCACGARWDYSCWNIRVLSGGAGHVDKVEMYRVEGT